MARPRGTPTRARLGPYFTEGARRLWQVLRTNYADDVEAMSAAIDVPVRRLGDHLQGERGVPLTMALAYADRCGIPAALFDAPPVVPFRLPAMVALLEQLRAMLADSPEGLRVPTIRRRLGARCETCKITPDLVLEYAVTDGIAKRTQGVWRLVVAPALSAPTSTAGAT